MNRETLSIAVTFLTGDYHGDKWPPAPGRLYQALVAGVMTCGYRAHAAVVEPALRWLERQPPPRIRACEMDDRSPYRIAVPNNDMDVVALEWLSNRPADPSALKTLKAVRRRQLRTDGPHVEYLWQVDATEANAMSEALRIAARCVYAVGWGIDMAFADLAEATELATEYQPAASGERLAAPMDGTWDDLQRTYDRFANRASGKGVDTHTRPTLFRMQPYRRTGDAIRPVACFQLMKPDADEAKAVAWESCMRVAGWLRHAAAESLKRELEPAVVEEFVQGHTKADDKGRRLSYVPLPNIYGSYGDGLIRRALIAGPSGSDGKIVDMLRQKLTGRALFDKDGQETCSLAPPQEDDWTFAQYLPPRAARVWRSTTPVVLPGFNVDRKGRISLAKTERMLLCAFKMAGYGEQQIERLAFQCAPWWRGTKHAIAMSVPNHLKQFPRLHVEVRFRQGVRGPMLAGIGRHYGIGVFARAET